MATASYNHPSIGTFTASANEGVLQLLGVQYATLKDRFAPPVLKQYPHGSEVDASKPGPQVLSVPNGADHEHRLVQQTLDYDRSTVSMSDTEGLVLNITVPTSPDGKLLGDGKLPVFVFIHGGGFNVGSAGFVQYDLSRFVKLSVKIGMPLVAVSLNYRTGAPGFLHSKEMKAAGYLPNNGLRDQRVALLWIQRYISGFGGDAANVSLVGESAGGASTAFHFFSQKPLFKRAMMMSGTLLLMPPPPEQAAEGFYEKAMKALELTGASPEERLKKLVEMDGQKMFISLLMGGATGVPIVDGDILPRSIDWKSVLDGSLELPGREWCESTVLGDCQFDGSINMLRLGNRKTGIAKAFHESLSGSLPSSASSKLFAAYGLTPDLGDDDAFEKILQLTGDLHFYAPTLANAQTLAPKMPIYMYRFNEPNTWPGPWQGRSTHIHDLVFLLQNFNEKMSPEQQKLAREFGNDVIAFVNGKEPWKQWKNEERVAKVLKAGETGVKEDVPVKVGRRGTLAEIAGDIGWDELAKAINGFMVG